MITQACVCMRLNSNGILGFFSKIVPVVFSNTLCTNLFSSEGPGLFCRSVKLQDQREAWEQKRTSLREVPQISDLISN